MAIIMRDNYLRQLIARKDNGLIKVITGIRRCGKSYMLFNLYYDYLISVGVNKSNIIALALDSDENESLRMPTRLYKYITGQITSNERYYIFLDEVQFAISDEELKGKEPIRLYGVLNSLMRRGNVDIYVTGSNSKFLSSDIMTEFRGRGDEVRIYPLSFAEFMSVYDGDKYDGYAQYSAYGGLPIVISKRSDSEKSKYLSDLLSNVYIKDITERNALRGDVVMDALLDITASSTGSLTNPTKLAKTFVSQGIKTNDKTVSLYLDYLQDAFLISKAKRYDIKGKKYINTPCKYYFTDIGLRNVRLNFRQQEAGYIMENILYNELLIRGYNVDVGVVDYYARNKEGKQSLVHSEVDFVCNTGSKRYYVQSAYSIPTKEKMLQEQNSLSRIDDSFKKIIVTMDNAKPWHTEKGYTVINALEFLLNADSMDI